MYTSLLQDWTTIRGNATTITSVTQGERNWVDLSPFQDIVAWLEVKEFSATSATVQMTYQTAPSKDDSLFVAVTPAFNVALGVTVTPMLKDTTAFPLSRWLRWQLSLTAASTTVWDATFRIWVAANSPGLRL